MKKTIIVKIIATLICVSLAVGLCMGFCSGLTTLKTIEKIAACLVISSLCAAGPILIIWACIK